MASLRSSSRLLANRLVLPTRSIRCFSSNAFQKPGEYVSGLTQEQVTENPLISDFLQSNFGDSDEAKDGYTIPADVLKAYGLDANSIVAGEENLYGTPRVDKGLGNEAQQRLNIRKLSTHIRHEQGTPKCDALRNEFWIPGMLYGSDPTKNILSNDKSSRIMLKTQWAELQRELDRYRRHFESRVYDLTIHDGDEIEKVRVLPRDVQRHPVQGRIYCANFLRYHAGRPIKIPIVYINQEESPALKRDGFIIPINKYVECLVEDGAPIPNALELECTGLQLKDVIKMNRLIFPDGVKPSKRVNPDTFVIGPVAGGRGGAQAAGEGEEGVEATAKKAA